jgi:ribosomal protein S18 acetylase RimI-like enzyme
MNIGEIQFLLGVPEEHRQSAAELYDEAFGAKFSVAISDKDKRMQLITSGLKLEFAYCAVKGSRLVGLTGFHSDQGSLTSGITYRSLLSYLGFIKGNWAAVIFSLYERTPKKGELVMDGISVRSDVRGLGIGTQLLKLLIVHATKHKFASIRLDVIDTNDRARTLYERIGFKSVRTERFEYLRWLLGFGASTTMTYSVPN